MRLVTLLSSIEVFADIWCPFTHVGLRMIDDFRRASGEHVVIIVKAWPLELVNGSPLDPVKTKANCSALREQVAPSAFSNGDFGKFPKSTMDALTLVAQAYEEDSLLGENASFALRSALFEEGSDINSENVLIEIARRVGCIYRPDPEHRLVLRDWVEGKARGVQGSPHFFHGDAGVFCPSLQISRTEDQKLQVHMDASRLEEFLRTCLM